MRAEAKKPIKSRKTGAKLYASTASRLLVALLSSASAKRHTRQAKSPEACGLRGIFYTPRAVIGTTKTPSGRR